MATNGKKFEIAKKQEETKFFVESMTNKYNGERQIQINDTYIDKETGNLKYARRGVNINVIDIPEVIKAVIVLYEEETGKSVEL